MGEKEERIECYKCKHRHHVKCFNVPKVAVEALKEEVDGLYWLCEEFNVSMECMVSRFEEMSDRLNSISDELNELKSRFNKKSMEIDQINKEIEVKVEHSLEIKKNLWSDLFDKKFDGAAEKLKEGMINVEKQVANNKQMIEEERDRDRRRNNVVLYNLQEKGENNIEIHKNDMIQIKYLLDFTCGLNADDMKSVYRIGKGTSKTRPVLVEFKSVINKNLFLDNLKCLSSADDIFKRVSVSHDFTPSDRELMRNLVKQAKEKQLEETGDF